MRMAAVYGASLAVHLGLAGGMLAVKAKPRVERVAIMVREVKKPAAKVAEPAKPPPETPEPPKAAPRKVAMKAPKAAPAPAAPSAAPAGASSAAAPEFFGLTLGGGPGGDGLAVPAGRPAAAKEEVRHARPKVLAAAEAEGDCAEEPVKPKPINVVQPAYNDDARAAQIEGKVRVELTVDADGAVTAARVLAGLGHGLDEAALEAARASTFEPGTRCGKAAVTTFTIGMRFSL